MPSYSSGGEQWRPRCVEDTVDHGVHPAVAAMRLSGNTRAPELSLDSLSRLGLNPNSLVPVEKKPAISSPPRYNTKKEKRGKKKQERSQRRGREKRKSKTVNSPSSSGSSRGSTGKKKKENKNKEKFENAARQDKKSEKRRLCEDSEIRDWVLEQRPTKDSLEANASCAAAGLPNGDVGDNTLVRSSGDESVQPVAPAKNTADETVTSPTAKRDELEHSAVVTAMEAMVTGSNNTELFNSVFQQALRVLVSGSPDGKEAVACAIADITPNSIDKNGSTKVAIAKAGVIPPLVALLKDCSPTVQKQAGRALHNLTSKNTENKAAVLAAGGMPPLLAIMKHGAPTVQQHVVGVLRNLTGGSAENKAAVMTSGAISTFLKLLPATTPDVQANLAVMLYNLANNSPERRAMIEAAGAVPPLVKLLNTGTIEVRKEAADTLRVLIADNSKVAMAITAAGVAQPLASMIKKGADLMEKRKATQLRDQLFKHGGAGVKAAIASARAL